MNKIHFSFSGKIVQRGFWIYIWKIDHEDDTYFYVGRTGDSSSVNAASPMSRMAAHFGRNVVANALKRNLTKEEVEMHECEFACFCFGPLMDKKDDWPDHVVARDMMATIEKNIAEHLSKKGCNVLGVHHGKNIDTEEVKRWTKEIVEDLESELGI